MYALAFGIGLFFFIQKGFVILILSSIGFLASFFYTGGFIKYKHHGWGEFSVFLMWGPLMVFGSYYVQTGNFDSWAQVLLVSIPQGLWVALVIFANNLTDIPYDSKTGVKTLANRLGTEAALKVFLSGPSMYFRKGTKLG